MVPPAGLYGSVDWATLTAPLVEVMRFREAVAGMFGEGEPQHPPRFYDRAWKFREQGVLFAWGEDRAEQGAMLQVQGHWFLHHPAGLGIEVLRHLREGMGWSSRITRLDLALDFVGVPGLSIVSEATAAGHRGEFDGVEVFEDHNRRNRTGRPMTKAGASFGNRESEVYVRFYDKGLEQRCAEQGYWERAEVELKGSRAEQVREMLLAAEDPFAVLASVVVGAMSFKRPFWDRVLSMVGSGIRVKPAREQPTIETWEKGLRSSYGPALLARAKVEGVRSAAEFGRFVLSLLDGVDPNFEAPVVLAVLDRQAAASPNGI